MAPRVRSSAGGADFLAIGDNSAAPQAFRIATVPPAAGDEVDPGMLLALLLKPVGHWLCRAAAALLRCPWRDLVAMGRGAVSLLPLRACKGWSNWPERAPHEQM